MNNLTGKKIVFFLPLILVIALVVVVVITLIFGSISGRGYGVNSKSYSNYAISDSYSGAAAPVMMEQNSTPSYRGESASVSKVDRKIVKNGSIDMLVKKVEETAVSIHSIVAKYDGQVDSSNLSNSGVDVKYGTMTIRVPNDKFDLAVGEIEKLAVKVNSLRVSSDDVTSQYVDLESRLKSKKAVEQQYVALLQRANKVEEIVTVHSYLDKVREEIEILQGQINYLANQVSMSSITISMTSEAEVQILGITWHPITVIKQSFRNLLEDLTGIADWLVVFVFALPGFLIKLAIFALIVWVIVKVGKKVYRKMKGGGGVVS